MDRVCTICADSREQERIEVREMFFGTGERFVYGQCHGCGCLALEYQPVDMASYYPADYYAFRDAGGRCCSMRRAGPAASLRRLRTAFLLTGWGLPGRLVCLLKPAQPLLAEYIAWLRGCHVGLHSRILDVGCGMGRLVRELSWNGFTDLHGIDAFIGDEHLVQQPGLHIRRAVIGEVEGSFDCIMLHHSLEHMGDPLAVFRDIARLLRPGGTALIRTPTVSSYAWERYRQDWVQLDAPRHLFVHSLESIGVLARRAGLCIRDIVFDSTAFQFWGSIQYQRGIPLNGARSWCVDPGASLFSSSQMEDFRQRAARLNLQGRGDQICVYLTKGAAPR